MYGSTENPSTTGDLSYTLSINTENNQDTTYLRVYKGNGYLAPPLVEVFGDGAGAVLTADVDPDTGEVTAINVIDGGSGYRPIPPTNTQAQIVISTGRVTRIIYR